MFSTLAPGTKTAKASDSLCGQQTQDLELTVAQIIGSLWQNSGLKWKKVGKTARPFRYDLNQIPYEYILEVTDRFKRLGLVHRMPEELWMEVSDIVWEAVTKTIPKEKKCKKAKWLFEEVLQIAEKRRKVKGKGETER